MPEVPPIPLGGQGNQHFGHFMPQDTIFIWDWDDTLMCSTEMRGTNLLCHGELDELEAIGKYLLENSLKLGDMKIVTNGTADWVRETSTHYLPELLPIVMRYPSVVISARSCYEDEWPGDANAWKLQAFKDVLLSRQSRGQSCKNIIVLGDSFAEINAAQEVSRQLKGPVALKTVKFIEEPSKANLVSQLQAVKNAFTSIVQEPKEAFFDFSPRSSMQSSDIIRGAWFVHTNKFVRNRPFKGTRCNGKRRFNLFCRLGPDYDTSVCLLLLEETIGI